MTVVCVPLVNCRKKERILPFKLARKCLHGLTGELAKIEIPVGVFPFWIGTDGDVQKPRAGWCLINGLIRQELLTILFFGAKQASRDFLSPFPPVHDVSNGC